MKRYTLLCAIGAAASIPAFASDADMHRIYVAPMVGAFHADNATDAGRATNRGVAMLVIENPGNFGVKGEGHVE